MTTLDFRAGWRRAKLDVEKERAFVRHPYVWDLIEMDVEGWLTRLGDTVSNGQYFPQEALICDCPKSGGGVRPGSVITPDDAIVFTAAVDAAFEAIHAATAPSDPQRPIDFSYQLRSPDQRRDWFRPAFECWQAFTATSLRKLGEGAQFVVMADIAGYYEHVDLKTLSSDLRTAGVPDHAVSLLSRSLNQWTVIEGKGIPQGHSGADLLGKLYLNPVDRRLAASGLDHIRYVDDFRIFCQSSAEARRAVVQLTRLLRERGLSLQTSKLKILRADEADKEFNGVRPIIATHARRYLEAIVERLSLEDPYITLAEAEHLLKTSGPGEFPDEIIEVAFQAFFVDGTEPFHASLFRFLLNRLGKARNRLALDPVSRFLKQHPEETAAVLRYLERCDALMEVDTALVDCLVSTDAVYDYQAYQVTRALGETSQQPSTSVVGAIRVMTFQPGRPVYLRAAGRYFLMRWGDTTDWDRLEAEYREERGAVEQVEIICSIARLERTRLNAFLGRLDAASELHQRAARWARNHDSRQ